MSGLNVETDDDGRISINLGEVHTGTTTRLVAGDDGIIRAVTTKNPDEETVAEEAPAEAPASPASLTDEELQAELDRRTAANEAPSENK